MKALRLAVQSMETTRAKTDPVRTLRDWRLGAEKAFLTRRLAPKKGRGK